jgi:hypothetical protein
MHLSEDDPNRRMEFCEWVVNSLDGEATFPSAILFIDEANFYINGEVAKTCVTGVIPTRTGRVHQRYKVLEN